TLFRSKRDPGDGTGNSEYQCREDPCRGRRVELGNKADRFRSRAKGMTVRVCSKSKARYIRIAGGVNGQGRGKGITFAANVSAVNKRSCRSNVGIELRQKPSAIVNG